ncbi:hypothetical protein CPB84DRAFT_1772568 [Gymnopilus junonius]|uniref:Uncharacterized protein n=1 Tax=Gymnopilus junonius TaxID=109634 RepID=A0A9P5NUN3_GYMJU|nr:hypothetical protein CPB84DRAFT_1772568 [Gymnopilus junonius]
MEHDIRKWVFYILNIAVFCLTIAVAFVLNHIISWRKKVIPTIQDLRHAPLITRNYITLPAIHMAFSVIIIFCSAYVLKKSNSAMTAITIAIGFTVYLTDVIIMPIFFLFVLPSPNFTGCFYWFTNPEAISNDEAARGCHLLTGLLYGEIIAALCIMTLVVFMWIPLLSDNGRLIVYPSLPRLPPIRFRLDAALDARAEPNQARTPTLLTLFRKNKDKDIENQVTIESADPLAAPSPTILADVSQSFVTHDLDDIGQDGAA